MRVPIQIIEWGIERPKVLRTLLFIKKYAPGYIKEKDFHVWAKKLGIHTKTFSRHLAVLSDMKWVNLHNGTLYLRSLTAIRRISGYGFKGKYYIAKRHLEDIDSWIFSCVVDRLAKYQRRTNRTRLIKKGVKSKLLFAPLSVRYIALCTGVSKGRIQRLKAHAIKAGTVLREGNGLSIDKPTALSLLNANKFAGDKNYIKYHKGYFINRTDLLASF